MFEDILIVHRKSNRNFTEVQEDAPLWKTCLRQILFCNENNLITITSGLGNEDQVLRGEHALGLLLEILCGLHSPIVGETEVFGQFKTFVESRKQAGDTLFEDHQKWLHFILAEVKKIRSEHLVGIGSQSYGSLLRRYTKNFDSVSICGSGQLAQEILPWVALKTHVQVICRDPAKMQGFVEKYNNLSLSSYSTAYVHGEALIIAAPVSDGRLIELLRKQETRPQAIYDLRGEANILSKIVAEEFPHIQLINLQQFFSEIEENKRETQHKIQEIKSLLLERALSFVQRTELRPLGWDDLCA